MQRIFPFGRGGRGSRQRLVVDFGNRGWKITVHEFSIRVLRTHAPNLTVLMVGKSENRIFFTSQIFEGLKTLIQAGRDFRTIRRINKIQRPKENA